MLIASCLLSLTTVNAYADADCSDESKVAMDAKFGASIDSTPISALTTCLKRRENIKVVMALMSTDWNVKANRPQQVGNAHNLVDNYIDMYGMINQKDFDTVVVGYAKGARWLLTDEAYDRLHGTSATVFEPNPSKASIQALQAKGVTVLMCQNTMKGNGYVTADVLPGVSFVPAGVTSLVDHQYNGYKYLNP